MEDDDSGDENTDQITKGELSCCNRSERLCLISQIWSGKAQNLDPITKPVEHLQYHPMCHNNRFVYTDERIAYPVVH